MPLPSSSPFLTAPPSIPGMDGGQPPLLTPKFDSFHLNPPDGGVALTERVKARIDECRKEMGLDVNVTRGNTLNRSSWGASYWGSQFTTQPGSWSWRREVNQMQYDDEYAWRKAFYPGDSIFQSSNYSKNIAKPLVRKLDAKLNETQFGTDPYFATIPQQVTAVVTADAATPQNMAGGITPMPLPDAGGMQPPVAPPVPTASASPAPDDPNAKEKAWEAYIQRAIGKSNWRDAAQDGRLAALIRNDATVKQSWVKRSNTFFGPAKVLVAPGETVGLDELTGQPVVQPGGFVTPDGRQFAPGEPVTLADGRCIYASDDVIPSPVMPGMDCLLKDPTFVLPPWATAEAFVDLPSVKQVEIEYEGLDAAVVDPKDFLFPIKSRTFAEADFFCHIYDATLNELRALFGDNDTFELYAQAYGISAETRARPQLGEADYGSVRDLIGVHECYVKFDADEDGEDEWVFAVYDYKGQKLIFFDYLKNHMRRAPFIMLPGIEKRFQRAYGSGVYEMLEPHSEFVDMQLNRWNFMASKAGSATFIDEDAIVECKDGAQEFVLGSAQTWTVRKESGYGPDKSPVWRTNLAEQPENAVELMKDREGAAQLAFGIIGQDDASAADLNNSKTATGVVNIQQTGNALQNKTADLHAQVFTDMLEMAVEIIRENMPEQVAFYLDDGVTLAYLSKQDAKSINLDVRLLMSKARSGETLQRNQQATQLVLAYLALPKANQKVVRQFFIEQLRALDIHDADDHLPNPTDAEIQAEQQAAQNQDQQKPASASVAAKLGDFIGSERSQIVQRDYGITPASPQEVQQAALASAQEQLTPAPSHHLHALPPAAPAA